MVEKSFFGAEKKILENWVKNRVSHRGSPLITIFIDKQKI